MSDTYDVPPGRTAVRCGYCDAPLETQDLLALHRGLEHAAELDSGEREAYENALDEENETLRRFRLMALGVLVVLYFGLLMVAAFCQQGPGMC